MLEAELGALDPDRPVPLPEGAEDPGPARRSGSAPRDSPRSHASPRRLCCSPAHSVPEGSRSCSPRSACRPSSSAPRPRRSLPPSHPAGRGRDRERLGRARRGRPDADRARGPRRRRLGVVAGGLDRARLRLGPGHRATGAGRLGERPGPGRGCDPRPAAGARVVARRGVFALAAAVLGWVLAARHASIALLGAMVWAAAVDAGLSAVGNGALGGRPLGVVGAAVAAVGIEFLVLRGREPVWHRPRRANGSQPLTT